MAAATTTTQKGVTMTYLPIGTILPQGEVIALTLTAYKVAGPQGTVFVPFIRVHNPGPATPLVTFG